MTAVGIALMFQLLVAEAPAHVHTADDELNVYITQALEGHPLLEARYAEWEAAMQRIPQVRSFDDPHFTYGQFIRSDVNRMKLALSQRFSAHGTRRLKGDRALSQAHAKLEVFYAERDLVVAETSRAYLDYAFLYQNLVVTDAQLEILQFIEENVRSKYSLGLAREDALVRVQIEVTKIQDRHDHFLDQRMSSSMRLSEAIGRPGTSKPLPWPTKMSAPSQAPAFDEVARRIAATNPNLRQLEHLRDSHESAARLAGKAGRPNVTLGLEYLSVSQPRKIRPDRPFPASLQGARRLLTGTTAGPVGALTDLYSVRNYNEPISRRGGGEDAVMVSVGINVPLWRKRVRAGVAEEKAMTYAVEQEREHRKLSLESAARTTLFQLEDGQRRDTLYAASLLPQAQRAYESLQSAYTSGASGVTILDLLDSVRVLLDFQLEQVHARHDMYIAHADLQMLMGGPWRTEEPPDIE